MILVDRSHLPRQRPWLLTVCMAAAALLLLPAAAAMALERDQVLLIVNTSSADSLAIRDAYVARHGSAVRVWEYAGSTSPTISRTTFESQIRAPLDAYLRNTTEGGTPLCQIVRALVTTKGVPRRIDDYDNAGAGDRPTDFVADFNNGKADAASVDAELVLLHQLLQAGPVYQQNGTSYYANNYIRNPYHAATQRIATYSRANVASAKNFSWNGSGWNPVTSPPTQRLTPGDIYLVCRLTGYTAAEAIGLIDRGSGPINVYKPLVTVVIDRDDRADPYDAHGPFSLGEDYPQTRDTLAAAGFNVHYDATSTFLTQAPHLVIGYASYGRNHSPAPLSTYILSGLQMELPPGAAFNTFESFNGRNFETASPHDYQGQVAYWVRIGGTLAFGHVYEPCSFAVADNDVFYQRMLIGTSGQTWTFAEAAYAAMPLLSWQHVVVGDPLTRYVVQTPTSSAQWVAYYSHGGVEYKDVTPQGRIVSGANGLTRFRAILNKQPRESTVNSAALSIIGQASGNQGPLISAITVTAAGGSQWLLDVTLSASLPDADRYTISLTGLRDIEGYPYYLNTMLQLSLLAGDVNASGTVDADDVTLARAAAGTTLDAANYHLNASGSGLLDAANMRFIQMRRNHTLP